MTEHDVLKERWGTIGEHSSAITAAPSMAFQRLQDLSGPFVDLELRGSFSSPYRSEQNSVHEIERSDKERLIYVQTIANFDLRKARRPNNVSGIGTGCPRRWYARRWKQRRQRYPRMQPMQAAGSGAQPASKTMPQLAQWHASNAGHTISCLSPVVSETLRSQSPLLLSSGRYPLECTRRPAGTQGALISRPDALQTHAPQTVRKVQFRSGRRALPPQQLASSLRRQP